MLRRRLLWVACAVVCAGGTGAVATAASGPDPAFGVEGTVQLPFGIVDTPDIAIDSSGFIVAAGEWVFPVQSVGVARVSPEGRIDGDQATWSIGTKLGFSVARANAVAVDSQDRIVLGGVGDGKGFVARLLTSGLPDASFGQNGVALLPTDPAAQYVFDVGVDASDRVVALQASQIARLTSAGGIDTAFGDLGVTPSFSAVELDVAPDGSVTTAAQPVSGGTAFLDASVRRFGPNGQPDETFGTDGEATVAFPRVGLAIQALHVDGKGRVLVGGNLRSGVEPTAAFVFRLTASGALDAGFAVDGIRQIPAGTPETHVPFVMEIDTAPDGTIVAGGVLFSGPPTAGLVALLTDDGAFDPDFNGGAPLLGPAGDRVSSVVAESNTSFVVAASKNTGGGSITRLLLRRADTTAPHLTVPADQTVEAVGPAGATASFAGLGASDDTDPAPTVTCDATSTTVFAIGATTVTCIARDIAGNQATATFKIMVVDTTPPALVQPARVVVDATSSSGATVAWDMSAVDLVDGTRTVVCVPAPGTQFAIGETAVACTATDTRGNRATGSTAVRVQGADEQLSSILDSVTDRRLLRQLRRIDRPLERTRDTCRKLERAATDARGALRRQILQVANVLGCTPRGARDAGNGHRE